MAEVSLPLVHSDTILTAIYLKSREMKQKENGEQLPLRDFTDWLSIGMLLHHVMGLPLGLDGSPR